MEKKEIMMARILHAMKDPIVKALVCKQWLGVYEIIITRKIEDIPWTYLYGLNLWLAENDLF